MANRPKTSSYMGHVYKFVWARRGEVTTDDGAPCWGLTDTDAQTIRIERGMGPTKEREIVIHEVLHQLIDSGLLPEMPPEAEEPIVTYLGRAIGAHMQDNPEMWTYLAGLGQRKRREVADV